MRAPAAVRLAQAHETDAVAGILTDSFGDEAGLNYWLRQGRAKQRARARFFHAAVRDGVHPARQLWLAEAGGEQLGAAIWLAPGQKAFDLTPWRQLLLTPLMLAVAGVSGALRGMALADKLAPLHPQAPHAHLVFLGVASAAQGQGVGSAILKHTLAPCDQNGVVAYLEASTERNVALYRRYGFEVTGEVDLPGLHFWGMTRPPQR